MQQKIMKMVYRAEGWLLFKKENILYVSKSRKSSLGLICLLWERIDTSILVSRKCFGAKSSQETKKHSCILNDH